MDMQHKYDGSLCNFETSMEQILNRYDDDSEYPEHDKEDYEIAKEQFDGLMDAFFRGYSEI